MQIDSWLGIRNTNPMRSIPNGALSSAVDVDINDQGTLIRRNGFAPALTLSNVTSAYSTQDHTAYIVYSGNLYRILSDLTVRLLCPSTATSFYDFGKVLFTNDGLKIENDRVIDLKIPEPDTQLTLSVIPGTMPAGTYRATYCYRSADGLEGGSGPISTITLTAPGGISVAPVAPPTGYTAVVYTTDADGTVYYAANGVQLQPVQVLSGPFPDNVDKVAFHEGKVWASSTLPNGATVIRFSSAFHHHLFDYTKDYIVMPGTVRDMASANGALLIGTDAAIFAYEDGVLTRLAEYGVPVGRAFTRLPEGTVYMHTARGICKALPFENITEKKCSFSPGLQCSTALVERDGMKQLVVVTDGGGQAYNASF